MPIPDRETIKAALIELIRSNGGPDAALTPSQIYDPLAKQLSLTPSDRALKRSTETLWENEVRWARQALVEEGLILPVGESHRGVWKLAEPAHTYGLQTTVSQLITPEHNSSNFDQIHGDLEDEGVFSPVSISDARKMVVRSIVQRRGQQAFRFSLLEAYSSTCCISGENCIEVLEAAHIVPYLGSDTNHIQNGLLLRADIHTLFDLKLLSIEPQEYRIQVCRSMESEYYRGLHGKKISLPLSPTHQPSPDALLRHFLAYKDSESNRRTSY